MYISVEAIFQTIIPILRRKKNRHIKAMSGEKYNTIKFLINKTNKMKKTILAAALFSIFSMSAAYAQDAPPADKKHKTEHKGEHKNKMKAHDKDMYKDLNLTADQENELKALNEDNRMQMDAIKNDAALTDEQRKAKMMELKKAKKEKMQAILTPEQKAKWEEKRKNGDKKKDRK